MSAPVPGVARRLLRTGFRAVRSAVFSVALGGAILEPAPGVAEPREAGTGNLAATAGGNFVVGPEYRIDPDLTDRGNPKGKAFEFTMALADSKIFKGDDATLDPTKPICKERRIFVYVPAAYVDGTPAPVLVMHDGPNLFSQVCHALDNLTRSSDPLRRLPPFIVISVENGGGDSRGSQRGLEYDTMSDRLARFVNDEVFPAVLNRPEIRAAFPNLAITADPWGRAVMGCSSGGAAALTMGWFRPDLFRRLITYSGTFVDHQDDDAPEKAKFPLGAWEYHSGMNLIGTTEKKPLRVFVHVAENDVRVNDPEETHFNFIMANERTAAALASKGYDYRYVFSKRSGHCDNRVVEHTLADTLVWMWHGYGDERAATAAPEYRHPVAVIPYAAAKPAIDGVVDDAEWQGAFSQRASQTTGKQISARQPRVWMMWDEEHLYLAMRDPLRPGERLLQSRRRERGPDPVLSADDLYEIWVSVDATDPISGDRHCSAKFVANFAGARFDTLVHPGFGSSFTTDPRTIVVAGHRPNAPGYGNAAESTYESGWEPRSRITDRNEWELELAIPRASLGITKGPFHDGLRFRTLFARNYQRPAEQVAFDGSSSFADIDTHTEFVMSKTAPALHLVGVGDAAAGTIGLHLAALGQADAKIAWRYASDTVTKDGTAEVKKGVLSEVVNLPNLDAPGDQKTPGTVRITVTDAGGAALLDWQSLRSFGPIPPGEVENRDDELNLGFSFNPVRDYARVFGDLTGFADRAAIEEIVVTVRDAAGKEVERATPPLDADARARAVLHFENLAPGAYTVRLKCLAKDGTVLAAKDGSFTKEDLAAKYEWWNTPRGSIEKVISPWTPVTLEGKSLGVWGRTMEIGAAGIPARVSTQGKEILAAPGKLTATLADGKELSAEGVETKTLFDQDHRKIVAVESTLGEIAVTSEVRAEFDGLYKVTMTLTPKQPVGVKNLTIVLPYAEGMADYLHAATTGIRSGFFSGFTPKTAAATGRVWDCRGLGGNTMRVGSFIPYVWLGSTTGGLCWFADSDEGWIPNDETPAIEIRRNTAGQVDLVLNLIGSEAMLDAPRTITFALQASPVKPLHKGWREDPWWARDTFKPYAHDQALQASSPWIKGNMIPRGRQMVEDQHNDGRLAIPYFVHTRLPWWYTYVVREGKDNFMEEWVIPGNSYASQALCYGGSLNDYMIHYWSRFAELCGIDGCYLDNVTPYLCDRIEAGRGYRLPDGRVQPGFQMFGTREYLLRLRAAFLEQRQACKLVLHASNHMIVPWIGAADVVYDGAQHVIFPGMKQDFMDLWPLERLRADWPGQWGTAVNVMHQYQGEWDARALHVAMRAYFAAVMLHDALPTGNHDGHADNLIAIRRKFGIGTEEVKFLPYWDDTGLHADGDDIKLAGWLRPTKNLWGGYDRPDKLLLLVANFGEAQTAQVTFDLEKLGWKYGAGGHSATLAVSDPEHWPPLALLGRDGPVMITRDAPAPKLDGTKLTVPVERHNYRLLVVEKK